MVKAIIDNDGPMMSDLLIWPFKKGPCVHLKIIQHFGVKHFTKSILSVQRNDLRVNDLKFIVTVFVLERMGGSSSVDRARDFC